MHHVRQAGAAHTALPRRLRVPVAVVSHLLAGVPGRKACVTAEQQAEIVERTLAGEAQCIYCQKWKPISLLALTTRGYLPFCPHRSDADCDQIFTSMSDEQLLRLRQLETNAERHRTES